MDGAVYIMDELKAATAKVDAAIFKKLGKHVYWMFGHPLEIVATLQEMTKAPAQQSKKYPLVALFTDIPVRKNVDGFYGSATFTMIIATLTQQNLKAQQRLETNFKPLLQPIKQELINQIGRIKQFTSEGEFKYTEIEHHYWGSQGIYGNTGNIFNDYIDCIELRNFEVNIKNKICITNTHNF